jgi:hypothetical protein
LSSSIFADEHGRLTALDAGLVAEAKSYVGDAV